MIWRERAKKKTYHLPRCLFTREDVGSGISDEFRTGQSAFRTRSRGCGHGRVYLRQVTSSGTLAGSRPWKVRLQEDTGRVTFLQGNYSGCYVFVTALAYRAQSVRNEIRQQLPIFFSFFAVSAEVVRKFYDRKLSVFYAIGPKYYSQFK